MIQVEVQIWNKRWWQVFKRQNSPEAAPWYTEYQKLEHLEHGVRKISEHVGRKFPKPPRAQGTWYKRHENHKRKEGGHIKKEMCETQQHVRQKAQEAQEPRKARTLSKSFCSEVSLPNQLYIWGHIRNKVLSKAKKLFSTIMPSTQNQ